ncbi:hypothetical protein [Actinospica robiniae]|uniref:hypothetical protein n=1 Tax=Actinospica robiniae TaxID=304901 RepID=UPI00041F77D7|nr:hypothetical protein [Actinospica robiniae]
MSAQTFAAAAPTITPDLAAVLHDARPHPQLGPGRAPAPSSAQLGRAAAALAAGLAAQMAAVGYAVAEDDELIALATSYLLPPGTRARVHRAGAEGVLVLAPSDRPRAVAAAGPGLYVVVETAPES